MHHTIQFAVERSECGPGHHDREGPAADQSPRPLDRWSSREWNRTRAGRCEIVTAVIPARAGNLGGAPSCWHRFVCDGRAQWATGTSGSMLGSRQRASIPPVMAAPGGRQCSEQGQSGRAHRGRRQCGRAGPRCRPTSRSCTRPIWLGQQRQWSTMQPCVSHRLTLKNSQKRQ